MLILSVLTLSRIVGVPGDKIQIANGILFVNDKEITAFKTSFNYKVILGDHPPIAEYDDLLMLDPLNQFGEYQAILTEEEAESIKEHKFVLSVKKILRPKGYHYAFSSNPIFPNHSSFNWSRDNFGPIIIPKKGDEIGSNKFLIKNNYYFALGDNRLESMDSRYFGLIPECNIVGKVVATLYSKNGKN